MNTEYVLPLADGRATLQSVGGKGASLARLAGAKLPVPDGFHITTDAYQRFVVENELQARIAAALHSANPERPDSLEVASHGIGELFAQAAIPSEVAGAIAQAYASLPGDSPIVAVRSSATAEDLPELSFAGQHETFLNVKGATAVLDAVKRCWASLWTGRAIGYRAQHGVDHKAVSLAVVVQLLVPAEAAGILFTADPLNGQRDRAVISASWGLGEAVVGGQVTPDTIRVEKKAGRVLAHDIADKQTMTVRVNGGTAEQAVSDALRRAPVLHDEQALELTRLGTQIEQLYGMPMDIEWALADGAFSILQARPITALPPAVEPLQDWPLPNPKGHYMRGSMIELLPDPLTPLFATLGVPAINAGFFRMLADITGQTKVVYQDETVSVINGYAYMGLGLSPGQWWWLLTRLLPKFPSMVRNGVSHWRDEVRPRYIDTAKRWQERAVAEMRSSELWTGVHQVFDTAMDYLGSCLAGTMGAAAGSEGLLTNVYNKMVRREGDPPATTFVMGYDSIPIRSEKALYDLAAWCRGLPALSAFLLGTPASQIARTWDDERGPADVTETDWDEWRGRFHAYLKAFGHSIYNLDFARPLPADEPVALLETLRMYLRGEGADPHERQRAAAERRRKATETMLGRTRGLRGWAFRSALGWAQKQAEVREDAIADMGLGYPMLRQMLQELGRRFASAGAIAQPVDIYWLTSDEVENAVAALERGDALKSLLQAVEERRAAWNAQKQVAPPVSLPPAKKYMGFDIETFTGASADTQAGDVLKGVGASAGRVTGVASVLRGPEDFSHMQPGTILVARLTTPAWTPLFAMASGVVTDIGGPLSHGSIVAREYGIPAVLGTGSATRRIHTGQCITVDGSAGTVALQAEP